MTDIKRDEEVSKSYLLGPLVYWNKTNAIVLSNKLQSIEVFDDPTSKFTPIKPELKLT